MVDFCCRIVDATAPYVCAFKPQIAYFAAAGAEAALERIITYVHDNHPLLPVILDAKRGDVGSTARQYAREAFERYDADAVTVNPLLGPESVEPFLEYPERGVILLCRTSNPGSDWLQLQPAEDPLYLRVAQAALDWNRNDNLMLVAGATQPAELARIRERVGDMPLLVPGVGAQGGDLQAVLARGCDSRGQGLVINSARGVIFAGEGTPDYDQSFDRAAGEAAAALQRAVSAYTDPHGPQPK